MHEQSHDTVDSVDRADSVDKADEAAPPAAQRGPRGFALRSLGITIERRPPGPRPAAGANP